MRATLSNAAVAAVIAAGLSALSACAPQPKPQVAEAAPPPPPPRRVTQIDGFYTGGARLVSAEGRGCPRSGHREVQIFDHILTLNPRATVPVTANVTADGSVSGGDGRTVVSGQLDGDKLDLTVSSPGCELRYFLKRG